MQTVESVIRSRFPAARAQQILSLALPAIAISTASINLAPGIGRSRFGGWPDLPPEAIWPCYEGAPMVFVAQINLADLKGWKPAEVLPEEGLLSFFADDEASQGCGCWYNGQGAVLFYDGAFAKLSLNMAPRASPRASQQQIVAPSVPPAAMRFAETLSLPYRWSDPFNSLQMSELEMEEYSAALGEIFGSGEPVLHQMLGHAATIQHDNRAMLAGLWAADSGQGPASAEDMRLLLQVDTLPSAPFPFTWGDGGHLYFWIHVDDLAKRRFDRVLFDMDCS